MKCLRQGGALSAIVITSVVCSLTVAPGRAEAQTLPTGWTSQDIGTATGGSATGDSTSITVRGSGENIWGTTDAFHYASRSLSGDFTMTARVASFTPANEWAKAGLMVREGQAATARNVYALLAPGLGHALQTRSVTGGTTSRVTGSLSGSPTWLRLSRRGSTFTGYASRDGATWTTISTSTVALTSTVQVGFAVTSRDSGAVEEATFSNISVQQTATEEISATAWNHRDIGSPALAGSWSLSGGTHTVTAAGTDIWYSADQFHFAYQLVSGDVDMVARVASLKNTDGWAKAGIMIRESLTAGSRHNSFFATPSNGWSYQYRSGTDDTSFGEGGPAGQAPGWVRLTRQADVIRAYTSPDGNTWALESSQTVAMGTSVYVGLAVTSHNSEQRTTATFTNVAIGRPSSSGSGQAPTVSFASPANGATFTAPATIYVAANASDADGSIARVDLYQGTTLLKSDYTNPYSFSWTNVPAGTYQLRAVARDNSGATQTATISVTVNPAGNSLPTVAITAPSNNASYTAPATVTVQATASDSDGTVSRVEFYRGTTLIASDTTSPYSATWSSAPAGSYTLTARAYDNNGAAQTSSPVNITIGSTSNQPPTVSLTSPTAGATFTAPASITLSANAADADGTIARVDFYAGTQLIATDTSSPYSASWTNVAAGTYSLTAVARDNAGATRTSSAVSISVGSTTTRPTSVSFNASTNHDTAVTSYVAALYRSVDPVTASPMATRDLGKPTPVSGVITSDISTMVNALPSGSYYAVVTAVGSGGSAASTPSATFTK